MKEKIKKVAWVNAKDCISCQACVVVCPHQALYMASNNKAKVNIDLCNACGECIAVCPVSCIIMKKGKE